MRTSSLTSCAAGALFLATVSTGLSQPALPNVPSAPLPPAPESRILDPARVFTFDQLLYDELSARLRDAHDLHGLDVYIAAYSFLLNETIEARAKRLAKSWLTQPRGLVIVYVRGDGKITFAASDDFGEFLPTGELEELFTIAAVSAKEFNDPAHRLKAAGDQLVQSVLDRLQSQEKQASLLRKEVILLAAGALVVLALLAMIAFYFFRLDRRPDASRYFPSVRVAARFGAPHGGASPAEISFANPPSGSPPDSGAARP